MPPSVPEHQDSNQRGGMVRRDRPRGSWEPDTCADPGDETVQLHNKSCIRASNRHEKNRLGGDDRHLLGETKTN